MKSCQDMLIVTQLGVLHSCYNKISHVTTPIKLSCILMKGEVKQFWKRGSISLVELLLYAAISLKKSAFYNTTLVLNNISHNDISFERENTYSSPEKEITRKSTLGILLLSYFI